MKIIQRIIACALICIASMQSYIVVAAELGKDDLVNCIWKNGNPMPEEACAYHRQIQAEAEKDNFRAKKCAKIKRRNLTPAEKSAIVKAVKDVLKDPGSAKFKFGKLLTSGSSVKNYCGLVNAKNSYGGYVGDNVFFAMMSASKDGTNRGMVDVITVDLDESAIDSCRNECYFP